MNKVFYLLIIAFLCSCSKDGSDDVINLPQIDNFTAVYKNNPNLTFVNSDGEKINFVTTYEKRAIENELPNNSTYILDDYFIQLNSSENDIEIILLGSAFVSSDLNTINPSLNIKLMPFRSNSIWMDINPRDGTHFSTSTTDFYTTHELIDISFNDVYAVSADNQTAFSALYYNQTNGVIGFKDGGNQLWRLDQE